MAANHVFEMNSNVSEGDHDILMMGDHEEIHNQSGSEDAENNSNENQDLKRKRYHRHTPYQIQEMEAFFKDCPHPDNRQRKELSDKLGMEPLQVKFWFQNRRTQMKTKHDRQENAHLRAENDKLRAENMRYREALINASCPTCGGMVAVGDMSPYERHLRMENARLREEIDCISAKAAKYVGKPFTSSSAAPSSSNPRSIDLGRPATFFEGTTSNVDGYSGAKDFDKTKNN